MRVDNDLEVEGWIDRLAVQDLIYRYSDAVTRADWDQCEVLFAPDAVWESPALDMRYECARSFLDMLRQTSSASELLIQTPHAPVIRLLEPERAKASTTIHEFTRGVVIEDSAYGKAGTPINFEQYGIYFDEFAKVNEGWRFTRRLFVPMYIGPDRVTGDVVTYRSALSHPD